MGSRHYPETKKASHIGKPFIGWTEQQFGLHNLGLKRDTTQPHKDRKGIQYDDYTYLLF
jgi:hypothetical protein